MGTGSTQCVSRMVRSPCVESGCTARWLGDEVGGAEGTRS